MENNDDMLDMINSRGSEVTSQNKAVQGRKV